MSSSSFAARPGIGVRAGHAPRAQHSPVVVEWTESVAGDDDRALAELARTDGDAFAELYRRYAPRIHAFAYRRSGSREVAEDVTAATFEKAWRGMPAFQWRGGGFAPWVFRIASTEIAGWYRRQARGATPRAAAGFRALSGDDATEVELPASSAEGVEELRAVLPDLPSRYQEALQLRYLAGLSNAEAAEAMGCSRAAMALTVHRALGALRTRLGVRAGGATSGGGVRAGGATSGGGAR